MRSLAWVEIGIIDGVERTVSGIALSSEEVLSSLAAGVIVISDDGLVTYANPAAAQIFSRPIARIVGRSVARVLAPLDLLLSSAAAFRTSCEVTISNADATQTVVLCSVSDAHAGGARSVLLQPTRVLPTRQDERDRRLQMAALGDALPSILHELRNPLAAVTSALEVLIEDCDVSLHGELHAILWEVRRMGLSLQGVGGLVRPVHVQDHVAVDLAVLEACDILGSAAERRGVQLFCEVPNMPRLPLDRGVVSGMVFNLVKNALDACEQGGRIRVRASLEPDETFALEVSDDGVGMTTEVLRRCTELFFTSKDTGSGIGLALCQRVADSSGGALTIVSAEGKGTHVKIAVPIDAGVAERVARSRPTFMRTAARTNER
jgi:two-component system sensor histidine kinase AtoS